MQLPARKGGVDAVPVPLPKVTAERISREEGYRMTSDDVSKWNETVSSNAAKEHLSFPLNVVRVGQSTASLSSSFKPKTDLEKEMAQILDLTDEAKLKQEEELKMVELTPEEVCY